MQWRNLLIFSLCCSISATLAHLLFGFLTYQNDSASYINAIEIMAGQPAQADTLHRLVKPIALLLPASLNRLTGLEAAAGLLLQQGSCLIASAWLIYQINRQLFQKPSTALLAVAIYLTCQTVIIYNSALMTDGTGWCMELLCIYIGLRLFQAQKAKLLAWLGLGALMGLAFFVKESVLMAGLWVLIQTLLTKNSWRSKITNLLSIGTGFIFIVVVITLYTEWAFNKSMLTWIQFAHSDAEQYSLNLYDYTLQVFRSLDLHWVLALWGIYLYFNKRKPSSLLLLSFLLTASIGLIVFPWLWAYRSDRILFMITLFLIPFAAQGAAYFKTMSWPIILISGAMGLFMTWRIYAFKESGWLLIMLGSFVVIFVVLWSVNFFKQTKF